MTSDTGPAAAEASPGHFIIESEKRLSESRLWAIHRRFFDRQGIEAWRSGAVPYYVTNNPALARAYAEVALGFLRDLVAGGARFDANEPFTIIEIGAGSGRFAFFFVATFRALLALSPFAAVPFRYVMTDFTTTNLAFWRAHEALVPLAEAGLIDFAVYDAECDDKLTLERSQATLAADTLANAPLVIANYVLDGISQDAFSVRGGTLMECRLSLRADRPECDWDDPDVMAALTCSYSDHPVAAAPYAEQLFNAILDDYAASLDETTILFPATALRCLDRLARLAAGRLLLLTADRGEQREEDVGQPHGVDMGLHGNSLSLPVNYHAIAEYVVKQGGEVLTTAYRHASLAVSAFLLGGGLRDETRLAFDQAIEHFGPDDFYTLRRGLHDQLGQLDIGQLLALVRLSGCDPRVLRDCLPALWERLGAAGEAQRQEIGRAIECAAANYYHLGEPRDLLFEFALLRYGLKDYAGALDLYRRSREHYGDHAATFWNMALCHAALGDAAEAAFCLTEAKRLDADFAPVTALRMKGEDA